MKREEGDVLNAYHKLVSQFILNFLSPFKLLKNTAHQLRKIEQRLPQTHLSHNRVARAV